MRIRSRKPQPFGTQRREHFGFTNANASSPSPPSAISSHLSYTHDLKKAPPSIRAAPLTPELIVYCRF